ncbi:hypothetical protein FEM03_23930 [Phragmitibacter flavus]|uniref:Uncharacterized protein n=1 Tax=Phragmitibacter flavus TaxID=2576071 RepID=A0A5R8K773_9BACT|nr:hypothetical protein [Phragmitibacter flavus]TLD68210.1 hypothetical protein FEM03_23930 [Phragmitibacter flavus]
MIKRLLSFIRCIREPTFDDPKTSRWADLFQKRARLTGQLPEPDMLQKLGIPADDPFWKQDNSNPSAGFAVNVGYPVGDALRADSFEYLEVVAVDDFGRLVRKLPLSKTSSNIFFHSSNTIYTLNGVGSAIEPSDFIWRVSRVFGDLLRQIEAEPEVLQEGESGDEDDDPEVEPMSFNPADYTINRITWDKSLNAWYVITDQRG